MSLILDALKRAERERALGAPPAAAHIVQQPMEAPRRSPRWLGIGLLVLAILFGISIAVIVWLVQQRREGAGVLVGASLPTPAAVAPAPASAPPQPIAAADSGDIKTLDDLAQPDQPPVASADDESPPAPPPAAKAPPPKRAAAPAAKTPRPAPRTATSRGPIPGPVVQLPVRAPGEVPRTPTTVGDSDTATSNASPSPADAAPAAAPPAPDLTSQLRQMPEPYRAQFPQLNVDVHVYDADPQRRFVMIGGRRYHEGETLAEGPKLIQIVPEGMVLEWNGKRVLYAINR